ncbi:DEAD/DEAH box helicase [Sphingomonas bacterium]|uniref:DEAD/DEAH box helicase n=1 Tax=Sphingomonas bacterium TaxID=1895847 RepID=UPI001576043D|nr:DEAD/DEAH box helicase [Sphingomonas bacterium]
MPFSQLPQSLQEALTERGYAAPTAVQAAMLQEGADTRDLIVSAQTGSGKTVAFGMAMAEQLLPRIGGDGGDAGFGPIGQPGAPGALVIAPTRELALQVSRELQWLYAKAGARIVSCVGGMDPSRERRLLSHGAHVVVGTPGRLRDHLERGALDLSTLKVAVLDEADEMLDMGFREDLEGLLDATPDGRRTLLFSATIPKPIVALARRYQRDAMTVSTVGTDRGHGDISYQALAVAPSDIEHAAVNLLRFHEPDTAIVFCATREAVRQLHARLVERGFDAVALSGEHSQAERNHALQALRDRRARVCVATDVAARGIDLPNLSLVIHAELPRDAEALQHRSGRTGRAGRKGIAALIVPYPRRRRTEAMLRDARVAVEWIAVPTPEDIRVADRQRLLAVLSAPVELDDDDRDLGAALLAERSAEEVAGMLVRAHRAKLPAAEDLLEAPAAGRGAPGRERGNDAGPGQSREGFEDAVWFRMNIGRRHNADPRWLLPLLCRRGHLGKGEVGAIRIAADETMFEIPRGVAGRFLAAVKRTASTADPEGELRIEPAQGGPAPGGGGTAREGGGRDGGGRGGGPRAGGGNQGGLPRARYGARPTHGRAPRQGGQQ